MNEAQAQPEWAPDDCPPAVTKLIDDDRYLHKLGLRLASCDGAELHQAVNKLKFHLSEAYTSGLVIGYARGRVTGGLIGAIGGAVSALVLARLTGLI